MNPNELTGDESAAALSLVTNMSEGLMPQMAQEEMGGEMPMEEPKEPEIAPESTEEEPQEDEKDVKIKDLESQIGDLTMEIEIIKKAIIGGDKDNE